MNPSGTKSTAFKIFFNVYIKDFSPLPGCAEKYIFLFENKL